MKYKVAITLLTIGLFLISAFGVYTYIENQRYERYLSFQMTSDISRLTTALLKNQQIYSDVIDSDIITLEQAELLYENNFLLARTTQELQDLAVVLKKIEQEDISNITATNASDIGYLFSVFIWDEGEREAVDNEPKVYRFPDTIEFALAQDEKEKIELIDELNKGWIDSVVNNNKAFSEEQIFNSDLFFDLYQDNAINSEFWVDLIVNMEIETKEFLTNNYLDKIGTILY